MATTSRATKRTTAALKTTPRTTRPSTTGRASAAHDPHRDLQLEHYLRSEYGIEPEFFDGIPLVNFDIAGSRKNNARLQAIFADTVEKYTASLKRGIALPAIVVYRPGKTPNAKYVVVDGNHRLAAYEALDMQVPAYVLNPNTDPTVIDLLTSTLNVNHGMSLSTAEAVDHAMRLVDNNVVPAEAAQRLGIKSHVLARKLKLREGTRRLKTAGGDRRAWESLTEGNRYLLHTGIKTDEGFIAAVDLAWRAKLSPDDIKMMIDEVKRVAANLKGAGAKQAAIVGTLRDSVFSDKVQGNLGGASRKRGMPPKMAAGLILTRLDTITTDKEILRSMFGPAEREERAQQFREGAKKLIAIAKALEEDD